MTLTEQSAELVGWISTASIALILGSSDPRTGKLWCQRHKVALMRDGRYLYAKLSEVRAVFERLSSRNTQPVDQVSNLVHKICHGT